MFKALALDKPHGTFSHIEFEPGALGDGEIDIAVESCGVCHSDLSMANNDWGMTQYPFVPGHEVIGLVSAVGAAVHTHKVGDRVGFGWYAGSCSSCMECLSGNHNLCKTAAATIIGRHGGFASHVRGQALWATPLPAEIDARSAGPLFCGGITVFNPLVQFDVKPYDRVGVIGIGGLGHLALQFLNAWGCHVTAFSSSSTKADEARKLGAHAVVDIRSAEAVKQVAGSLNFILSTANADLDWQLVLSCLAPKGRLHFVGAVPGPLNIYVFPMIVSQASISATPLGSPATVRTMIEFCARHNIKPVAEFLPMSRADEAFKQLEAGKARYRIVLENDL